MGRRCVLEIQDGSQITRNTNNFSDVLPMLFQTQYRGIYETSKSPAIMADATSCRKSKMAAN